MFPCLFKWLEQVIIFVQHVAYSVTKLQITSVYSTNDPRRGWPECLYVFLCKSPQEKHNNRSTRLPHRRTGKLTVAMAAHFTCPLNNPFYFPLRLMYQVRTEQLVGHQN